MKRWLVRICVLLLLLAVAALVNVAVAWGAMMLPQPSGGSFRMQTPGPHELRWWREHAPDDFEASPTAYFDHRYFGRCFTDISYEEFGDPHLAPTVQNALRRRAGWPMLALDGATWSDSQRPGLRFTSLYRPPPGWPGDGIGLPYAPLPRGFVVNTLFYAAILGVLFLLPSSIRRSRRIRRGLCPKCGYPRGSGEVCTECGASLFSPSR